MARRDSDTDTRPARKPPEGFRSPYPDLENDYPFSHPPSDIQRLPLLEDEEDSLGLPPPPYNGADQVVAQPRKVSLQRPITLRPLEEGETRLMDGHSRDHTPVPKGVSFVEKNKMAKERSPVPGQRRQPRKFSVSEQTTIGGKACAVWRNVYTALGLRQWTVVIVLIAYAIIGGLMFSWLEKGHTRRQNDKLVKDLQAERENLTDEFFRILNEPWLYPSVSAQRAAMIQKLREYQYERGLGPKAKPVWDLWDGVFFSFTVFTTIGYGHYTPVTKAGRIATIVYALIGIPLLLAILADFGRVLTRVLNRMWSTLRGGIRRVLAIRRFRKLQEAAQKAGLDLDEEGEGAGGIAAEDEEFNFPIPLAVFLIVSWLFICAAFFLLWETNWTYFEAFYFFFISLSTIGLGDLVPEHQKYMIANFPFVLIGLSLVTLVINLIQNKIEEMKEKAENMLDDQMGLEDEETETDIETDQEVHFPRPDEEEGGVPSTPSSPTGPRPRTPTGGPPSREGSKKKPKPHRINLGIIQTHKLPKNRRGIATQTEDSFVRDVVLREGKKGVYRVGSDRYSVITGNSEYFDAQSLV